MIAIPFYSSVAQELSAQLTTYPLFILVYVAKENISAIFSNNPEGKNRELNIGQALGRCRTVRKRHPDLEHG